MTETRMPQRSADGRAADRRRPGPRPTSLPAPEADPSALGAPGTAGDGAKPAKPWLKATALVTVSTSGVVTGLTIAPGPAAALTSPSNLPPGLSAGLQSALQAHLLADRARAVPAAPDASASSTAASGTAASGTAASGTAASGTAAPAAESAPEANFRQAFFSAVAPGAIAAEHRYGVPASVTIAQAIDESDWGRSRLSAEENNLFGIKGTGPAGSVTYQTSEYEGGHWVTVDAKFRAYHNVAESIEDHAALLATSGYYTRAMAVRAHADAFANALTGVYATDPHYGATLIALMRSYDLYRYDSPATPAPSASPPPPASPVPSAPTAPAAGSASTAPHAPARPGSAAAKNSAKKRPAKEHPAKKPVAKKPVAGLILGSAGSPDEPAPWASVVPVLAPSDAQPTAGPAAVPATGESFASIPGAMPMADQAMQTRPAYYQPGIPEAVTAAVRETARPAIADLEPLYREAAARSGISWKLLAACDWMQCQARPRYSPVYGEKLGTVNPDGSCYATKSQALARCAADLTELASAVYGIDLTARHPLSVRALAEVFAAYRWGGILARHGVSALEFPYSVAGLTAAHTGMRWPAIHDPDAPDRLGSKFRPPFGAVPLLLSLGYPATV